MDSNFIQKSLLNYIPSHRFRFKNTYVFGWESDICFFSNAGYCTEIEIKISRSDFFADFKKKDKHEYIQNPIKNRKPHYFYYACQENLIDFSEIPTYAGLIYVTKNGWSKTIKTAPKIHKEKLDIKDLNLTDKLYYKHQSVLADNYILKQQNKQLNVRKENIINQDWVLKRPILETNIIHELCENYIKDEWFMDSCKLNKRCTGNCEFIDKIEKILKL